LPDENRKLNNKICSNFLDVNIGVMMRYREAMQRHEDWPSYYRVRFLKAA
jgi:hypothetical protein